MQIKYVEVYIIRKQLVGEQRSYKAILLISNFWYEINTSFIPQRYLYPYEAYLLNDIEKCLWLILCFNLKGNECYCLITEMPPSAPS